MSDSGLRVLSFQSCEFYKLFKTNISERVTFKNNSDIPRTKSIGQDVRTLAGGNDRVIPGAGCHQAG